MACLFTQNRLPELSEKFSAWVLYTGRSAELLSGYYSTHCWTFWLNLLPESAASSNGNAPCSLTHRAVSCSLQNVACFIWFFIWNLISFPANLTILVASGSISNWQTSEAFAYDFRRPKIWFGDFQDCKHQTFQFLEILEPLQFILFVPSLNFQQKTSLNRPTSCRNCPKKILSTGWSTSQCALSTESFAPALKFCIGGQPIRRRLFSRKSRRMHH